MRVHAGSVNPLDIKIRTGKAALARHPLPAVLGLGMAGTVTGPGVTSFHPGDEAYGMVGGHRRGARNVGPIHRRGCGSVGAQTSKGFDAGSRHFAAGNDHRVGGIGRSRRGTRRAESPHSCGRGGVGQVAVQLANAMGAEVFGTVSAEKRKILEQRGAVAIDYRKQSAAEYVAQETGGVRFEIVYDTVGGSTLDDSFTAVKHYTGHAVSCLGWGTRALAPPAFRCATYSGVFTLLRLFTGQHRAHHGRILTGATALADEGKLRPLLDSHNFTIEEVESAYRLAASGSVGKVVPDVQAR